MLQWTRVAAVAQIAAAAATTAAVISTLRLAAYDRRPHLSIRAGLRLAIPGDGELASDVIAVTIANRGQRTVRIASLGWRTGWLRRGPEWLRLQYAVQTLNEQPYPLPVDLPAGQDVVLRLPPAAYLDADRRDTHLEFFGRKMPWRRMPRPAAVKLIVSIVGAADQLGPAETPLARLLTYGTIEGGAARLNQRADEQRAAKLAAQ